MSSLPNDVVTQNISQESDAATTHNSRKKSDRQGTLRKAAVQIYMVLTAPKLFSVSSDMATLGWIAGAIIILLVACITYYSSCLLSDCYRSPYPAQGKRNHSYVEAVRNHLGKKHVKVCGMFQLCEALSSVNVATTATIFSWRGIHRTHRFHKKRGLEDCYANIIPYWKTYAVVQIILFLFPRIDLHCWFLNGGFVAQLVTDAITVILAVKKAVGSREGKRSIAGTSMSLKQKILNSLQACADITLAFSNSFIFLEIQDTLKSPPTENVTMKRASFLGISMAYAFYMLVGSVGYTAFGNQVPECLIDGFTSPFWLVNIAYFTVSLNNVVAYQVVGQPLFDRVEVLLREKWPNSAFWSKTIVFRLVLSCIFVGFTTSAVLFIPSFENMLDIIECFSFWTLTAYYPLRMSIAQYNIQRWSFKWMRIYGLLAWCTALFIFSLPGTIDSFVTDAVHPTQFIRSD